MFIRYISYELDDLKDSAGLGYPKKKKYLLFQHLLTLYLGIIRLNQVFVQSPSEAALKLDVSNICLRLIITCFQKIYIT